MHIVIVGAGALGGYYGSRWEEAGANVTYLVREKRAKQLQEKGMRISSTQGDYANNNPQIRTEAAEIKSPDLVLVGVKGYHLEGTLPSLKTLTAKGAYVLPVLNGIEHLSVLQQQLGEEAVIGGLAFIIATLDDAGHVMHSSDFHRLIFGPLQKSQKDICKNLKDLSEKAQFEAIYTESILQELWKKYMFINAFSGITTAVNLPIGPIRNKEETFYIAEMLLKEMQQLAESHQIAISDQLVNEAKTNLINVQADATSSMHQDRRKALPLELDHLHGGAIRMAAEKGLDLSYTKAIYGIIKPFAGGNDPV